MRVIQQNRKFPAHRVVNRNGMLHRQTTFRKWKMRCKKLLGGRIKVKKDEVVEFKKLF